MTTRRNSSTTSKTPKSVGSVSILRGRCQIYPCLLVASLLLCGLEAVAQKGPSVPRQYLDAREINFNLDSGHPFLGLATVIWPGAPFAEQRHDVLVSTQMNWVRVPLMNSFQETDRKAGMSVAQVMAQRPNHPVRVAAEKLTAQQLQGLQQADQRTIERYRSLGDELHKADINFVVAALPGFPKSWLYTFVDSGTEYKAFMGGQPGQPDHRQDYVTLVVAEILAARQAGLRIGAVEMPFEPDEPGGLVRPDVANAMVGKLRNTLNENGLANVEIVSPGTGSTLTAARYINAMQGPGGHIADVKYFSAHDYDTAHLAAPVGLSPSFLAATNGSKPILATEFNDSSPRWSQPPYLGSPRSSPPEDGLNPANASNHNAFAVSVAAEGLKLISDGATGVCVWEMNDISWKKSSYGLIDLHGNPRPAVAAFTTFMQQIGRASDVVAYGADAGPGLAAAAFRVTKGGHPRLIEVFANTTNAPVRIRVSESWQKNENGLDTPEFYVIATFPQVESGTVIGSAANPTMVLPPNTIVITSNLGRKQ